MTLVVTAWSTITAVVLFGTSYALSATLTLLFGLKILFHLLV